jgi:hypothetical protein
MILTLSDVKIGQPRLPTRWDNEAQKNIEYDNREEFISGIREKNHSLEKAKTREDYLEHEKLIQAIKYESDTLEPDTKYFHNNYMHYLEKCWADHLGIVITPDIIWFTILSEFASLVKANPETYRALFTDSSEKKEIRIQSYGMSNMSLERFADVLKSSVPTDTSLYFPEFGLTKNSAYAFYATFCDLCSPYYNYSMLLCGFPLIDVKGTIDDWKVLKKHWDKLKTIINENVKWKNNVSYILDTITENFSNQAWWKTIFSLKKCGSGHQTTVSGWFSSLFHTQPKVLYAENFSAHISAIKYKQLDTNRDYETCMGLFNSIQTDEFMIPSFSFISYDITDYKG